MLEKRACFLVNLVRRLTLDGYRRSFLFLISSEYSQCATRASPGCHNLISLEFEF